MLQALCHGIGKMNNLNQNFKDKINIYRELFYISLLLWLFADFWANGDERKIFRLAVIVLSSLFMTFVWFVSSVLYNKLKK